MHHMNQLEFSNAKNLSLIYCLFKSSYKYNNNRKGKTYLKMAENVLSGLKTDRIHRIDVNF